MTTRKRRAKVLAKGWVPTAEGPFEEIFIRGRARAGRPWKLSEGIVADVCELVRNGVPPATAMGACGIARATWNRWLKEAEEDPPPTPLHLALRDMLEAAANESESTAILELNGGKEWRRALAFLGRRFRDKWGQRVELTGADGQPLTPGVELYKRGIKLPEEDKES